MKIEITLNDNQVQVGYDEPITLPDFFTLMSTAILSAMQQTVAAQPEENQDQVREEIYDMYNAAASNTLAFFAPDIDMRPHLTAEAILKAENEIIEAQYNKLQVIEGGKQ